MEKCIIQFDFADATNMEDYEKLREQVASMGIDASLLVLNAGLIDKG